MSVSNLTKKLWVDFNEAAERYGLSPDELVAYSKIPKKVLEKTLISIGESLLGYWDSLVKDGWGSLDARMLHPTFRSGTIQKGFKRTWIAPSPAGSEIKVIVKKRIASGPFPGTLGGTITGEKYDQRGVCIERKTMSFRDGKYEETKEMTFSKDKFGFIAVIVDTRLVIGKSFAYSIRYKEQPNTSETRKVVGFADIHVHQTAEDAYAGNWLHGSMMGSPSQVLKPCNNIEHRLDVVPNIGVKKKIDPKDTSNSIRIARGGGFPHFREWPHHLDIAHQQVHENWLKQAFEGGMKLMVSSAVNSEVLALAMGALWDKDVWRDMNCLEKQIDKIHEFCTRNRSWAAVAFNPWHAREIIHSGKLAIVIAVECSNIFPLDQGDYIGQLAKLYNMGVRSVQIVHHCDNRFAGAAPQERQLNGIQSLSRLFRVSLHQSQIESIAKTGRLNYLIDEDGKFLEFDRDANGKNKRGLSTQGERLLTEMIRRHMLIDVSHYSEKTFEDAFNLVKTKGYYPLYFSHTKFQPILSEEELEVQKEFLTTQDQLVKVKETGGMVGLRTAPWTDQNSCCGILPPVQPDGQGEIGTARNYAQQVAYAYRWNINFAIGSDFNGFTNQLGPRKKDGTKPTSVSSEYWEKGLCHIGMLPELVKDLKALGALGAAEFDQSAEKFLKMWERTWDRNRQKVNQPARPIHQIDSLSKLTAKLPPIQLKKL